MASLKSSLFGLQPRILIRPGEYITNLQIADAVALVGLGTVELRHDDEKSVGHATVSLCCSDACFLDNLAIASGPRHALNVLPTLKRATPTHLISFCTMNASHLRVGWPLVAIGSESQPTGMTVQLERCRIEGSGSGGVCCAHGAKLVMEDCVVTRNGAAGIEVREKASAKLRRTQSSGNKQGM